jgi:hypothetical protein
MEEIIVARLLASAAVTAIVQQRVEFGGNTQGSARPRVAIWTIDNGDGLVLAGPDGVQRGRVQVDAYSDSAAQALALGRAITTALHGYSSGALRTVSQVSYRFTREGGANEPDRPYRVSIDFTTLYLQA